MNRTIILQLLSICKAIDLGYKYDPGDSDLDDEQPIHVTITLGHYRKACRLVEVLEALR